MENKGDLVWRTNVTRRVEKERKNTIFGEFSTFPQRRSGKRLWKKLWKTKNGEIEAIFGIFAGGQRNNPQIFLLFWVAFPPGNERFETPKSLVLQWYFRFSTVSPGPISTTTTFILSILSIFLSRPAGRDSDFY